MEIMHIAFCCDDNYIVPASVMLESLFNSNREVHIVAHTFLDDLNKNSTEKLRKIIEKFDGELVLHKLPEQATEIIKNAPLAWEYLSVTTYYRLMLPYVVGESVNKVLYLDCDVMVRKNMYKYYIEQEKDVIISGAKDIEAEQHGFRLKLSQYINAGVLIMNLDAIRERFSIKQMLDEMNRLMSEFYLKCGDQDIINILFQDRIKVLPDSFNYQHVIHKLYILKNSKELTEVECVHFITNDKPWHCTYCFPYAWEYYILLKKYFNKAEILGWWIAKPMGLINIVIKHIKWKKEQKAEM